MPQRIVAQNQSQAQCVEYHEMSGWSATGVFGQVLGENHVTDLLQQTLDEEGETNKKLTQISDPINADAFAADRPISVTQKSNK